MFFSASFPPSGSPDRYTFYNSNQPPVDRSGLLRPASSPGELKFDGWFRSKPDLSKYIDHTLLTYALDDDPVIAVRQLCQEAVKYKFYAVCIRPDRVALAKELLKGTGIKVATVIGFPERTVLLADARALLMIGDVPLWQKLMETEKAIKAGADEIDLVMNVHQFLREVDDPLPMRTLREIALVKTFAAGRKVKVIIETDLLTPEEIRKATLACARVGVDMVKTSTGMIRNGQGATVENVKLIKAALVEAGKADKIGIKASGGIRDAEQAKALVSAGATRLGTSRGVAIVTDGKSEGGAY